MATSAEFSSCGARDTTVAARAHHGGARGDFLQRHPQHGHVQVRAVLLDQLQFLDQHLPVATLKTPGARGSWS
ncbi:hypothetical protein M1O15_13640 [Streptomyces lichenis]|uniref:Uncharacterized protein n=1 Tax=Streptomyces lichenis TaxID=2306967 RepID=A0ABT0IAR8_9ACTN|nr:hypothetical protein [Streptomyces lichenis]MCK8678420.1 hypothetical protein [Streptomyces lichenis]